MKIKYFFKILKNVFIIFAFSLFLIGCDQNKGKTAESPDKTYEETVEHQDPGVDDEFFSDEQN